MLTPSDAERTSASGSNFSKWFAEEVQPHEPALRGYLRRQFSTVDVNDVVQESYLKLWRAGARVHAAKSYLFAIARNTARTVFRRNRLFSAHPLSAVPETWVVDPAPGAGETADVHHRLELAVAALDRLPPRSREICTLALIDGLSPTEIAAQLGIAESTVYVQMARGVKRTAHYLRSLETT